MKKDIEIKKGQVYVCTKTLEKFVVMFRKGEKYKAIEDNKLLNCRNQVTKVTTTSIFNTIYLTPAGSGDMNTRALVKDHFREATFKDTRLGKILHFFTS